jgi:ribose transport system ATP-binding protein
VTDGTAASASPPALVVRGLTKRFGGVTALNDVDLTLRPGEVHGLLGENGSGKSTLIKILAGFHDPDAGELEIYGRAVAFPLAPGQFRSFGIGFVHQDLAVIPTLSVLENFRIGELASARRKLKISWRDERRVARRIFERYGLTLDPSARLADLRSMDQALVAIVRALEEVRTSLGSGEHGVLVLDEPTVFLPKSETDELFRLIRSIVAEGASVLFVSHDLDEVREITTRITVLRDGRLAGEVVTAETSKADLVELIIGHPQQTTEPVPAADTPANEQELHVSQLGAGEFENLAFSFRGGEVLGLTGLTGSGPEDIPYLLFGARPCRTGVLRVGGKPHDLTTMTPRRALRLGMALVPADRKREGSVLSLTALENLMMLQLDSYFAFGYLRRRALAHGARTLMTQYDVRPALPQTVYASFSGGNQQKVLLAKWLSIEPDILLLHEPTQGVDVGAREQIFSLIRQAAGAGTAVMCASADHEELAAVCDRVLIFGRGGIIGRLEGRSVTKERISELCYTSGEPRTQ